MGGAGGKVSVVSLGNRFAKQPKLSLNYNRQTFINLNVTYLQQSIILLLVLYNQKLIFLQVYAFIKGLKFKSTPTNELSIITLKHIMETKDWYVATAF